MSKKTFIALAIIRQAGSTLFRVESNNLQRIKNTANTL